MGQLEAVAIFTHVVAGMTALFTAPAAMLSHKGGTWHRRWGKLFFWAIAVIFITALTLLTVRPNLFLLVLSVLTFYSALSGYRVLYRKHPDTGPKPNWLDWSAAVIATAFGLGLVGMVGFTLMGEQQRLGLPPAVVLIFGVGTAVLGGSDLIRFSRPSRNKTGWWFTHMGAMTGAFIGAVTAFTVQNVAPFSFRYLGVPVSLYWVFWVGPPVIGIFGQQLWMRSYRRKFRRGMRPSEVATVRIRTTGVEE